MTRAIISIGSTVPYIYRPTPQPILDCDQLLGMPRLLRHACAREQPQQPAGRLLLLTSLARGSVNRCVNAPFYTCSALLGAPKMRRPPKPVTLYIAQDLDPVTNLGKDIVIGIVIFRFIPHFPSSRAAATAELYCAKRNFMISFLTTPGMEKMCTST